MPEDRSERSDERSREEPETLLRVVRGRPDADELAAVTAVISVTNANTTARKPAAARVWAAPARSMRQPIRAGEGAWASSALR